ncbi:MAG TPA: DUF4136 domain-containing protein [Candidatus Omnitrophota bacterium]|mgnify:CR=1 FL=1|nr:DUF4136 domain-containing protein [Candidatus Omnitrophota bacterium]HPS37036.1 DUF4136 domain-containing protein [Candidatus Omnitrophota bacterium]
MVTSRFRRSDFLRCSGWLLWAVLFAAACSGCASVMSVQADYDTSKDFSTLKTYVWGPLPPGSKPVPELADLCIRDAVEATLQSKGLRKVDAGMPDLRVSYQVAVEEKTEKLDVGNPYSPIKMQGGMATVDRTWSSYNHLQQVETLTYEEGTLILNMEEPSTRKLVWRGTVSAVLDPHADPAKRKNRINEAVGKMLAKFPPATEAGK